MDSKKLIGLKSAHKAQMASKRLILHIVGLITSQLFLLITFFNDSNIDFSFAPITTVVGLKQY